MTEAPKPSRTLTVIQHAAMKRREALLEGLSPFKMKSLNSTPSLPLAHQHQRSSP